MGSWKKPDPELLPVHRPLCPKCQKRMITTAVSDGPEGFERRRFECLKCTVTEIRTLASDPLNSDALRWLSGELGPTVYSTPLYFMISLHRTTSADGARYIKIGT